MLIQLLTSTSTNAAFPEYKNSTKDMVKSLELIETDPLVPGMKIK
jgi:hypothetical protein